VDEAYTAKIKKYTTQPYFISPLVDYLPASKNVPTPEAALGDVSGAPGILPYAEEVYRYMRMLEKASPCVKVFSIGTTEEGREMIAVAISSEENLTRLDENRARLAKLADPRVLKLDDAEADRIVAQAVPVYYITGTIHSPETGAPTALMELAYRLAVDESPYIREIRDGTITLITPVVEVDGRNRMVDLYHWHLAHPKDLRVMATWCCSPSTLSIGARRAAPIRWCSTPFLILIASMSVASWRRNKTETAYSFGFLRC
jgi:hypothetical protein